VYFTQARARAAINAGFGLLYDNNTGTVYVEDGAISTSNIVEGSNLYFTNTRAIGSLTAGDNIVIEANGLIISSATLSSLPTLYTSNIVEDGNTTTGNVYFSNARARGAFTFGPGLTYNSITGSLQANVRSVNGQTGIVVLDTSNVAEGGANLYFTNTRAIGSLTAGDGIVIEANGLITNTSEVTTNSIANLIANIDTGIVGNLIPSVASGKDLGNATHPWRDLYISGSSIRLGSLVLREQNGFLYVANSTTGNIAFNTEGIEETANTLFFTNARVYASLTAGNNISASELANGRISSVFGNSNVLAFINDSITSANIREGSNLYFTNTRARRAFTAGSGIDAANLAIGVISISTGAGGILNGFINASNVIETGNPTTGNVFFTNARARAAFTAGPGINAANLAAGTITANVLSVAGKTGVVLLFTPNVIEAGDTTTGNVFFNNARARQAFTAGNGIDGANLANGIVSISGTIGSGTFDTANLKAGDGISLSIDVNDNVTITNEGVIDITSATDIANSITVVNGGDGNYTLSLSPNVYVSAFLNANNIVSNTLTVGGRSIITQAGLLSAFINASNVIETGSPTTGNVFFSNTRARRAFTAGAGINPTQLELGIIETSFDDFNLTTSNTDLLPEGTANLYFTNARAQVAIIGTNISIFNNDSGYLRPGDPLVIDSADIFSDMEAINNDVGHGNISFNPVSGTISFDRVTNANVRTAFSAGTGIDIINGVISLTGNAAAIFEGNTDSLSEGVNNLYYSNSRVEAFLTAQGIENLTVDNITVQGELILAGGSDGDLTGANLISTDSIFANSWLGLDTSDVPEGSNLYYTNARVEAFLASGIDNFTVDNITILGNIITSGQGGDIKNVNLFSATAVAANEWYGISTSNVYEGSNLYYTDARVYANVVQIPLSAFGESNVYVTPSNVRSYFSATGATGFTYDQNTGAFNLVDISATNPLAYNSNTRAVTLKVGDNLTVNAGGYLTGVSGFTNQDAIDAVLAEIETTNNLTGHGNLAYNSATGTITLNRVTSANIRSEFSAGGGLVYNNGVYSVKVGEKLTVNGTSHLNVEAPSASDVYGFFSADNNPTSGGYGSLTYNQSTGEFTYNKVTDTNIRGALSNGYGISYVTTTGKIETANLDIRRLFLASNNGTGYGSLSYDNGIGRYTFNKVTDADIVSAVNTAIGAGQIDTGTEITSATDLQVDSLGVGTAASGTSGEIRATNDITAFYSSDERLKTNIEVIDSALDKVNNIRGVKFDWNEAALEMYPDRTYRDVGVIAQEIEKVLPEVVVDRDNGYKAVRYEKLVPLLIEAIKELKQEIEELKKNG
jgi:hypothetical protein